MPFFIIFILPNALEWSAVEVAEKRYRPATGALKIPVEGVNAWP
jgi:hypothetical protein